jgi:hypothetical protein
MGEGPAFFDRCNEPSSLTTSLTLPTVFLDYVCVCVRSRQGRKRVEKQAMVDARSRVCMIGEVRKYCW